MDKKHIRFLIGASLGAIGTVFAVYLVPSAVYFYHWAVLLSSLVFAAGFAFLLFWTDYELEAPIRLRFFLSSYLSTLPVIFLAPTVLGPMSNLLPIVARVLPILPLLAIFIAIVGTYIRSLPVFITGTSRDLR